MPFPHLYPPAETRRPRSPAIFPHAVRAMTEAAARAARESLVAGRATQGVATAYATLRDGLDGLGRDGSGMSGTIVAAPAGFPSSRAAGRSMGESGGTSVDFAVAAIDMESDGRICVAIAPGGTLPRICRDERVTLMVAPSGAAGRLDPEASIAGFMEDLARAVGVEVRALDVRLMVDGGGPLDSRAMELVASTGPGRVAPARGVVTTAVLAATPGLGVDLLMGRADGSSVLVAACAARALGAACFIRFDAEAPGGTRRGRWITAEELIPSPALSVVSTGLIDGPLGEAPGRADGFDRTQTVVIAGPERERQQTTTWRPVAR